MNSMTTAMIAATAIIIGIVTIEIIAGIATIVEIVMIKMIVTIATDRGNLPRIKE